MFTIAHISDTHVGGHEHAADRIRAVLAHIASLATPVDVLLVTGDITDHGSDEEYADARALLVAGVPLLTCPGNHDVRRGYVEVLLGGEYGGGPVNAAHRVAGNLLLMCDSMVPAPPGERIDHGLLEDETLAWLDEQLGAREPGERAFVCLHHPPVDVHVTLMDPIKLTNAAALARVLGRHDDVVAVLVGHAHTMAATRFAGLPLLIGGGVASTVPLDPEPGAPITTDLPPSYAYHLVDDDSRVMTHFRTVPVRSEP